MSQKKVNYALYKTTIKIGASRLKQISWYIVNIIFFKNPFNIFSSSKVFLLRIYGAKIGKGMVIKPSVNIKFPWKLQAGNHCWVGEEVWIDNLADVILGDNVNLSQGSLLLCGSHDHTKESFDFVAYPIRLEDGVWIGARGVVFGGVTCKTHSILGINSVAEKDLESYTIYKGNPAIPVLRRQVY